MEDPQYKNQFLTPPEGSGQVVAVHLLDRREVYATNSKTNPLFFGDTAFGWERWDKKAIKRAWSVGAISHNVPLAWRSVRHEHFAKPKLCDVALCVGKPF